MGNAPSTSADEAAATKDGRKRRDNLNALSPAISKSTAAPPSASLESATAHTTTTATATATTTTTTSSSSSKSASTAAATPSQPKNVPTAADAPFPSHSRNRSQTIATPRLQPADAAISSSLPKRAVSTSSSSSHAIRVPDPRLASPLSLAITPTEPYHLPPPSYSRPPRLPLPIEEEFLAPGSPLLDNGLAGTFPETGELEDGSQRRVSVISSTLDGDDDPDGFLGTAANQDGVPKVPTVIEFREAAPGERVYVTGTFTDWQRKFRLHANGPSKMKGALSTTLQLMPGTHHIKFLVKDDMVCSSYLPTTVDYTNILVNYIEVLPDKPNLNTSAGQLQPTQSSPAPSRPLDIRSNKLGETSSPVRSHAIYNQGSPSSVRTSPALTKDQTAKSARVSSPSTAPVVRQPPKYYSSQIPAYLLDLDTWPPPSENDHDSPDQSSSLSRYHRANAATSALPAPPSLPLFLSKSILNGTTPVKDDSSVLIMPNHTVLNHLATTNIKQGVLATSATTRYKKKFLTTILYKPRNDSGTANTMQTAEKSA